jgi:hypothetical protein
LDRGNNLLRWSAGDGSQQQAADESDPKCSGMAV